MLIRNAQAATSHLRIMDELLSVLNGSGASSADVVIDSPVKKTDFGIYASAQLYSRGRQYALQLSCQSFCLSVCDNRPGVHCNLGLTGGGGTMVVFFLKYRGRASKPHSGPLAKYPK